MCCANLTAEFLSSAFKPVYSSSTTYWVSYHETGTTIKVLWSKVHNPQLSPTVCQKYNSSYSIAVCTMFVLDSFFSKCVQHMVKQSGAKSMHGVQWNILKSNFLTKLKVCSNRKRSKYLFSFASLSSFYSHLCIFMTYLCLSLC